MKKIALLGLISALPINTYAADDTITALDEIVVTSSRTAQSTKTVTGDITVIDREEINRLQGGSLADLLRLQPGVQTYTNGGMGTSSNISLRGTNDNQLIVLVDGVRINSGTTGTTAFENIPLALIERIEILRSPASSLYGSDAIGGVVQIFTKRGKSNKTHIYGSAGAGSYDSYTGNAGFDTTYQALKLGAQVSNYDTRGISAKKNPPSVFDKDRDGYYNFSSSAYADLELAPGHSVGIHYLESKGHNQYDNAYAGGNYLERHQQGYGIALKNTLTEHWNSKLEYNVGFDRSFSISSASLNSNIETEQRQLSWQHDYRLTHGMVTFAYDRLEQDVVTQSNGRDTLNRGRNNDAFVLGYVGNLDAHSTQLSLREDHNSQFGNFTTGGMGYGYALSPEWRLTAQYGSSFRAPTFNQLYAIRFGDSTLPSEKADNLEASVRYQGQTFQAKLTAFDNHIRNFIQTVTSGCPAGFTSGCAVNVGKIEIQGMTLEGSMPIGDQWLITANATIQSPRIDATDNLLARRAQRYGNVVLQYKNGAWDWSSELTASSERYNDTANNVPMSGYALLNSTLAYQINTNWRLQARANNILDKNYVLAIAPANIAYNTMGTNIFVSLNYDMK
ncbi:TonB-dependent receptor domain-containing protein [Methylophilus sp. 3sh_L]|uniref:TonB-dependent receptor domain-containing protein n=1 Tax=Methylophilus sp. 3sh_L TaxID=3377114 RepID=UPI00398F177A